MRIVSLLPSATEIVCCIGLKDHLVGVSHECDYPPGVEALPSVTQTIIPPNLHSGEIDARVRAHLTKEVALYSLDLAVLEELKPDIIVTQALCEVCAVAESEVLMVASRLPGNPLIVNLEPMSLTDVFDTIKLLGRETGFQSQSKIVLENFHERIATVVSRTQTLGPSEMPTLGFLEWIDPMFNAGHWTPELIKMAGGIDCMGGENQASITLPENALTKANPEMLFVALCGFDMNRTLEDLPLLEKTPGWDQLKCVRSKSLFYTDGNAYFSRPGPRLVDSLELIAHTMHPELHPLPTYIKSAERF